MKLREKDIEDLIYESPWLINERYIIPKIFGSQGQAGRQINIGNSNCRFIDLLFKDTRDDRPVIIELKQGKLGRENIGQILEYRSLLLSLGDNEKDIWSGEFNKNYFAPKLMLIGSDVSEDIKISANLAGIEIRTFREDYDELGLVTVADLKIKLNEWNSFRSSGNRTLIERTEWIEGILERINDIFSAREDVSTISSIPKITRNFYQNNTSPFIDIPIYFKDETLLGLYEYCDDQLPFDDKFIYCDYWFWFNDEIEEAIMNQQIQLFESYLNINAIDFVRYEFGDFFVPVIKIPRSIIESEFELRSLLNLLVEKAIEFKEN